MAMDRNIIYLILAGITVYFLHQFLLIMFVAFVLTVGLLPLVRWLKQKKVPRSVSSSILVFSLLLAPIILLSSVGPVISRQVDTLANSFPHLVAQVEGRFNIDFNQEIQDRLSENSGQVFGNALAITGSLIELIISVVTVIVVTIYWLIYYEPAKKGIIKFISSNRKNWKTFTESTFTAIEHRLGTWLKGQIFISAAVGLLTWVVLLALGVPYAGLLALAAAILELIPTLGPILAAIPALFIALTVSPALFILVLIAYVAIQQLESYVIAPRLLGSTVRLNPFVILLSIIAGAHLLGILGALIAVPVALTVQELYFAYQKRPAKKQPA